MVRPSGDRQQLAQAVLEQRMREAVTQPVVDDPAVLAEADQPGQPEHLHRVGHLVLGHLEHQGEIAHAQLTGGEQRGQLPGVRHGQRAGPGGGHPRPADRMVMVAWRHRSTSVYPYNHTDVRACQDGLVDARSYDFNQGWLFGGRYRAGAAEPGYDDSGFTPVTLPHTVTALSWGDWDPASWQQVWIYRKHFGWPVGAGEADGAPGARSRVFVDFDGVLVSAAVLLNGRPAGRHQGGYLPWSAELTGSLSEGGNVLAVIVDARWLPVPPDGAAAGAAAVDFLQPGGIYRDVRLRVVPELFLSGV